ncbi:ATP-binding protein [Rapidithrix thailandica]|uniref:ATP-binding protein n=1 Tax=Rapidithrix thailandica TaxID=413964 RepID=A0AAW9S7B8_9BACT
MELKELKSLIRKGESGTLDFKQQISSVYKIAKTIVSFANTRGGRILVGVTDARELMGVDPEEEKYLINEAARFYCRPPVTLSFDQIEEKGKVILIVEIAESEVKPHTCLGLDDTWTVYVRMNDKSVMASKLVEDNLRKNVIEPIKKTDLTSKEKNLLDFLKRHERITVKQYSSMINVSERRAKRILIDLTEKGLLLLHDFEKDVFYSLA